MGDPLNTSSGVHWGSMPHPRPTDAPIDITTDVTTDRPAETLADDPFAAARAAVQRLRGLGRDARGRVTPGNTVALKTGEHSTALWTQPDVASWVRDRVAEIRADIGAVSHVRQSLAESYARLELIESALGDNVFALGPLTGKGRTRAALSALLSVIDRKARLADRIGLNRQPTPITSVDDYLRGARR